MSLRQKYLKILSGVMPAGAVGAALLLGATAPGAAKPEPPGAQPEAAPPASVSERLAAIRDAVSSTATERAGNNDTDAMRLAWGNWWRNGGWGWRRPWGWGWPNWNNWRNWNNWPNWWRNW